MSLGKGFLMALLAGLVAVGCAPSEDEGMGDGTEEESAPVVLTEPEPEPVALPEGLPDVVHVYPEMEITEVVVVSAEELQFKIVGMAGKSVDDVLEYYEKYFPENGWEEDMIMSQPDNMVISFVKDGVMQYVEANEGGLGCYVTITTGRY